MLSGAWQAETNSDESSFSFPSDSCSKGPRSQCRVTCSIVILPNSHDHLPPQSDPVENNSIFTAELRSRRSRAQTPALSPLHSVNRSVTIKPLASHEVQYRALYPGKKSGGFTSERAYVGKLCYLRKGMSDVAFRVSLPVHGVLVWWFVIYFFDSLFVSLRGNIKVMYVC